MADKKSGVKSILSIVHFAINSLNKRNIIKKEQVIVKEIDTINLYRVEIKFTHNTYRISVKRCPDVVAGGVVLIDSVITWENVLSKNIHGYDVKRFLTFNQLCDLIILKYYERDK